MTKTNIKFEKRRTHFFTLLFRVRPATSCSIQNTNYQNFWPPWDLEITKKKQFIECISFYLCSTNKQFAIVRYHTVFTVNIGPNWKLKSQNQNQKLKLKLEPVQYCRCINRSWCELWYKNSQKKVFLKLNGTKAASVRLQFK